MSKVLGGALLWSNMVIGMVPNKFNPLQFLEINNNAKGILYIV